MTSISDTDVKNELNTGNSDDVASDPPEALNAPYDAEQYYMTGISLAILIGGLCLTLFLIGLDTAIISTVRHSIEHKEGN
jgi:hypothetical protein